MDKKISELDQALQINNDAVFPMSQDNSGTDTTYKASITQLSTEIGEGQTFSNLQTTDKTLVGAINEVAQGGGGGGSSNANLAPDYDAASTYAVGDWCIYNGTLYQCNTAIPTAEAFDPTHWTAKKVVDAFADIEDELDGKVDQADFTADLLPIESGSSTNTKDYIDTGLSGKADSTVTTGSLSVITGVSITLARSQLYRFGNLAFFSFVITTSATIPISTNILKVSSGFNSAILTDIVGTDNANNGKPFYISNDTITANGQLTSGASYFVSGFYRLA